MNLKHEANKLLTNKYFLYFIVFLSATNVIGYLAMNKINAVIFFALVSLLTYHFSKNMCVVLLVALVVTNLLMANKRVREGLENAGDSAAKEDDCDKLKTEEEIKACRAKKMQNPDQDNVAETGAEAADAPKMEKETFKQPEGVAAHASKVGKNSSARIDYASTLEQSYDNLDKMLGSDGITKLTQDTQKLMAQQQKLFQTMSQMTPILSEAKKMIQGFDLSKLGLTGTATNFNSSSIEEGMEVQGKGKRA